MICDLYSSRLLMGQYTVKNKCTLHHHVWWQLNCHLFWCNIKLLKKAVFYSVVSIWRMTTTMTGRNALSFITGEIMDTSCISRKVVQLRCHLFLLIYTHFTVKSNSVATSLVLTYTHFTVKSSSAASFLVLTSTNSNSENSPTATSLGVHSLPPSAVC